jgi:hypothetical protein
MGKRRRRKRRRRRKTLWRMPVGGCFALVIDAGCAVLGCVVLGVLYWGAAGLPPQARCCWRGSSWCCQQRSNTWVPLYDFKLTAGMPLMLQMGRRRQQRRRTMQMGRGRRQQPQRRRTRRKRSRSHSQSRAGCGAGGIEWGSWGRPTAQV